VDLVISTWDSNFFQLGCELRRTSELETKSGSTLTLSGKGERMLLASFPCAKMKNILFAAGLLYAGNFSVSDVALRRNFSSMGMFVMVALMTRMKMLVIPMFSVMLMLMIRFSLVIVTVRVLMGMIVRVRM
jgi:hypothetical protein